jgi:hypothetical protein
MKTNLQSFGWVLVTIIIKDYNSHKGFSVVGFTYSCGNYPAKFSDEVVFQLLM